MDESLVVFFVGALIYVVVAVVSNWLGISLFVRHWETLFGAIVGALLPIAVLIIWSPLQNKINKYNNLKTSLRDIQIDSTQTINDIADFQEIYSDFIKNIRKRVDDARKTGRRARSEVKSAKQARGRVKSA